MIESATTPAFEAAYAAWPTWPSNAAIDAVLTMVADRVDTVVVGVGGGEVLLGDRGRTLAHHGEGADQVDVEHAAERVEVGRADVAAAGSRRDTLCAGDAGAVDDHAERRKRARPLDGSRDVVGVGDVAVHEVGTRRLAVCPTLPVEGDDRHAALDQQRHRCRPEARRPTRHHGRPASRLH